MGTYLLAGHLKEGGLKINASVNDFQGLVDMLRRTDLSIDRSGGLLAEGHSGNITIRPDFPGSHEIKLIPNDYLTKKEQYGEEAKEDFAEHFGISIDELVPVEEEYVNVTKEGMRVGYRILLNQEGRNNPILTIQSYYQPR